MTRHLGGSVPHPEDCGQLSQVRRLRRNLEVPEMNKLDQEEQEFLYAYESGKTNARSMQPKHSSGIESTPKP